MTLADIRELLVIKDWTYAELARELHCTKNAVARWFAREPHSRTPSPQAQLLMKIWLNQARRDRPL